MVATVNSFTVATRGNLLCEFINEILSFFQADVVYSHLRALTVKESAQKQNAYTYAGRHRMNFSIRWRFRHEAELHSVS